MNEAKALLDVRDLEVVYSNVVIALKGVSLDVAPGQCVAVLGANGAGKSTLLKAVSGTLAAERGRIVGGTATFDGRELNGVAAQEVVKRGIVHVMEGRRILRHLTVQQNLVVGGHAIPERKELDRRIDEVCHTIPILRRLYSRTAGLLSGGEQQLLVIGRAMMARPKLMLIDEPSLGLAPRIIDEVFALLSLLRDGGMGILLVEQNARVALAMADTACVVEDGRVALRGSAAELRGSDRINDLYLGHDPAGIRRSFRGGRLVRRRHVFDIAS